MIVSSEHKNTKSSKYWSCSGEVLHVFAIRQNVYWTNKVRDQTFNAQFLQDFELLVKRNSSIIKVLHFASFVHLKIETIVFA